MGSLPAQQLSVSFFARFQLRLLCGGRWRGYVMGFMLGIVPALLSQIFGMSHAHRFEVSGQSYLFSGYWDEPNWLYYWAFLPAALWIVRLTANQLFSITNNRSFNSLVSDKIENAEPARANLQNAAVDGRNAITALLITTILTLVDKTHELRYFVAFQTETDTAGTAWLGAVVSRRPDAHS
jgi:hypothetical protein